MAAVGDTGRVSRDRTAVVPRAATPRDSTLAAAMAKLRAEHPEWGWATALVDEVQAQGGDVAELRADLEQRKSAIRRLKGWIAGSLVTALLAGAAAFRSWGRNDGLAEAAATQAAEYRARVIELEKNDRRQDQTIARLSGLLDRGTWGALPRRGTHDSTEPDPQGDPGP